MEKYKFKTLLADKAALVHTHEMLYVNNLQDMTKNIMPVVWTVFNIPVSVRLVCYGIDKFVAIEGYARSAYSEA